MRAKKYYEEKTGDLCPNNQIDHHEWFLRYVEWLEKCVERYHNYTPGGRTKASPDKYEPGYGPSVLPFPSETPKKYWLVNYRVSCSGGWKINSADRSDLFELLKDEKPTDAFNRIKYMIEKEWLPDEDGTKYWITFTNIKPI